MRGKQDFVTITTMSYNPRTIHEQCTSSTFLRPASRLEQVRPVDLSISVTFRMPRIAALLSFLLFSIANCQIDGITEIKERIRAPFDHEEGNDLAAAVEWAIEEAQRDRNGGHFSGENSLLSHEPVFSYGRMMAAKEEAARIAGTSTVLLKATELLLERFGPGIMAELRNFDISRFVDFGGNKCLPHPKCDPFAKYRSYSGWCNNLEIPSFGNAFHTLRRLITPRYQDGVNAPRSLSITGEPLPSPRLVSNMVHKLSPTRSNKISLILMQFGQLIDHEITHTPVAQSDFGGNLNCSRCDSQSSVSESCLPIRVPENDPRFTGCLPFIRSLTGQRTLGPREQMNQITSFLDGSVFYGSTKCVADSLRTFKGGEMRSTAGGSHLGVLLPQAEDQGECRSNPQAPCFTAGDERSSQQPMLQALHVVFLRHHNAIAKGLALRRRDWDDEIIYQETRRIVSAQFTHIVYNEFLPKVIGGSPLTRNPLSMNIHGNGYDPKCDASISQSFATAAFRFGHSLVARLLPRLDGHLQNITEPLDLVDNFDDMTAIYEEIAGGVDSILMGMAASSSMSFDPHVTTALRNHLFGRRNQPSTGMDLAAINIQRARDHGVASYNEHREFCGLTKAMSFSSLMSEMEMETIAALEKTYAHVDDIDLFTGLLSERPQHDALIGPTASCILSEQFYRLRRCDRYHYEFDGPGAFTPEQLAEIRKTTLSSIVCANSRLPALQPDMFLLSDAFFNTPVPCPNLPMLNLDFWA